jgi:hypothetical protein
MQDITRHIATYKAQLEKGDIREAYTYLLKYVRHLAAHFESRLSGKYSFGNISPGYMDFTYFPFFDAFLRERKLRFGIVLNHRDMRFELWLMGQNAEVQKQYWDALKDTPWNMGRTEMPKYSVLEAVLVEHPDFEKTDMLSSRIEEEAIRITDAIIERIKAL